MIKVIITAEARAHLSKTVDMTEEDFKKYQEIIDSSDLNYREIDQQIAILADKYGFGYGDDIEDMEDPEEVTFELLQGVSE